MRPETRTRTLAYSRQGRDRGGAPVYRQERATHIDCRALRTKQNCLYSVSKVKWKIQETYRWLKERNTVNIKRKISPGASDPHRPANLLISQTLATFGNFWRLMPNYDNVWQLIETYCNFWHHLVSPTAECPVHAHEDVLLKV